ncbi:uncharacterized protein LOC132569879, partial [Heteronotia binoei]|uniref:uncharacterized protein LOC132569879 n=1 Tax=Heteronotia binoei TaxID=13085 RepID=UPI00292DA614
HHPALPLLLCGRHLRPDLHVEREDIKEEHEVEDKDFYKFFVALQDFYQFYPKLIYSFADNKEQLEEQNSLYEGRIWVDDDEISEGNLDLILEQVEFSDEAFYICKATNSRGAGQKKMKLIVQGCQVSRPGGVSPLQRFPTHLPALGGILPPRHQHDAITRSDVIIPATSRRRATGAVQHSRRCPGGQCISAGWYHMPKVTWRNRREEDISSYAVTDVLEERQDGSHRVVSVLHYPVLLHEIYTCHIEEEDVLNRPVRSIHKVPKRKYHNMYNHY